MLILDECQTAVPCSLFAYNQTVSLMTDCWPLAYYGCLPFAAFQASFKVTMNTGIYKILMLLQVMQFKTNFQAPNIRGRAKTTKIF